jgi:hypothetical protein
MIQTLNYIAGLTDGEGSIVISKRNIKDKNNKIIRKSYEIRFTLAMNDKHGLLKVQEIFGGNINIGHKKINKQTGDEYCPAYVLSYSSREKVKLILETLLPYLQVKKEQAINALGFLEFIESNKYSKKFMKNGLLNNYYIKAKTLKQKNWLINK